ncbi:uncharacterized protein LOC132199120 [Neocloeon triangulifer]|uniref:uncharacterized protein LOC132199120 n=1 Tax=Neocloeon triangulifer TaxID=2078957 RepID=UPI00286F7ABB|nr:uncharacterized protein LOC132199120 [Neocloeon triangulifer]XP_059479602.1 uncharacterized protein LOC132199120 [Neocloeon triangulifer]
MATLDSLVCVKDFEERAAGILEKHPLDYYKSGAGHENSLQGARDAYLRVQLKPRVLRDVSKCCLTSTVLGKSTPMPFGVAPAALQRMAHPEGEIANARAAEKLGSIFVLSTLSTTSLEDVAAAAPTARKWFQLYIYKDREVTRQLVKRAANAGFEALVLTVDAPILGIRYADARNKFSLPPQFEVANFKGITRSDMTSSGEGSGVNEYVASLLDSSLSWKDIAWLKSITSLPIILKGILTVEDALLAVEHGAAGIVVSSHGARQIDTVPSPLEVLPAIVENLKGTNCEVYIDGGVSTGTDIFKAIALGAKMVFVKRPAIWGLACGGQEGVERVLHILKRELEVTMVLTGTTSIDAVTREYVRIPPDWISSKL